MEWYNPLYKKRVYALVTLLVVVLVGSFIFF